MNTSDLKLVLQWLPCKVSGVTGSALGLVCAVSVYCDLSDIASLVDSHLLSQCGSTYSYSSRSIPEVH